MDIFYSVVYVADVRIALLLHPAVFAQAIYIIVLQTP